MKKLKLLSLAVLFLISLSNGLFAQNTTPTPYQKKQLELSKKYYQIFYGYDMTMADDAFFDQIAEGKDAQEFLLGLGILSYAMNNSKAQVKRVLTQMKNEYEQAEKLKTAVDFQREKEAKYVRSDAGKIKTQIKQEFEEWSQKGEFENQNDFKKRLESDSKNEFYQICLKQINDKINNLKKEKKLVKELHTYDTENEKFTVSFKFNSIKWQNDIYIPITDAPKFKNEWRKIKYRIDEFDWCFINDSLCPSNVTLFNDDFEYACRLPLKNQKNIIYSFDDFKIDNKYLKGFVFSFSDVKSNIHKLNQLNSQLDSIHKSYTKKLFENPYNTSYKSVKRYKKIEKIDNMLDNYEQQVSEMKVEFGSLNSSFEHDLKSQDFEKYLNVFYTVNPKMKQEADSVFNEYRCHYKKRIDFDKDFIDNNLSVSNCREIKFQELSDLFTSKEEFDKFYNLGTNALKKEARNRRFLIEGDEIISKIKANNEIVERLNFKDARFNPDNSTVKEYFKLVYDNFYKPYYSKAIEVLIEINKDLNKEWNKKGNLFESKKEFFEAYTSNDYKSVLKDKKKN